jgi:site-specific recombinase XerD
MASELRERFDNHMIIRDLSPNTRRVYLYHMTELTKFYMRSPDTLTNDEIQKYLLHLIVHKKHAWNTTNQAFSAFRLFYAGVLKRDKTEFHIPPRPKMKQLPSVLSVEEVVRIIDSARNLKHRALLMTTYTAGLRVSEVVGLKPRHIESKRMLIRVEQGKGKKDRYTLLSEKTLETLRAYWKAYTPGEWLFFGRDRKIPMPARTAQRIFHHAKTRACVIGGRGIHTLRHCFATHLIDIGVDVYSVKRMMGHSALSTTSKYVHVTKNKISKIVSPFDRHSGS